MDQCQELRGDESARDLSGIVVRLRMIAVNLGDAARRHVLLNELQGAADGEAEIGQAALIAPASSITDHQRQNVKAEVIVRRPPDSTANQKSAIAASQI